MSLEICKMIMENPGNTSNRPGNKSCQSNANNTEVAAPLSSQVLLIPSLVKGKVKPVIPPKPKIVSIVTSRSKSTQGSDFTLPLRKAPRNVSCPVFDENGSPLMTSASELKIQIIEQPVTSNTPASPVKHVVSHLESRSPKSQSKESKEDISRKWIAQNLVSGTKEEICKTWIPTAVSSGRVGEISKSFDRAGAKSPIPEQTSFEVAPNKSLKPATFKPDSTKVEVGSHVCNIVIISEPEPEVVKVRESKDESVSAKVLAFSTLDTSTAPNSLNSEKSEQFGKAETLHLDHISSKSTEAAVLTEKYSTVTEPKILKTTNSIERSNSNPTKKQQVPLSDDSIFIRQYSLPLRGGHCWRNQVVIEGAPWNDTKINTKVARGSGILSAKATLDSVLTSSSKESLASPLAPPFPLEVPGSPALSPRTASDSDVDVTPVRPPRRSKRKSLFGENGKKLSESSESGDHDEEVKEECDNKDQIVPPIYRKRGQGVIKNIRKSSRQSHKEKYNDNKEKTSLLAEKSDNKCDDEDDEHVDRQVFPTHSSLPDFPSPKSQLIMAKVEDLNSNVRSAVSQFEFRLSLNPQSSKLEPVLTSTSPSPNSSSKSAEVVEHALNQILEVDEDAEPSTISGFAANSKKQGPQLVTSSSISSDDFEDALETQNALEENHSFLFTACPSGCGKSSQEDELIVNKVSAPVIPTITTTESLQSPSISQTDENENAFKVAEKFEQLIIDITHASSSETSLTGSNNTLNESVISDPDELSSNSQSQSLLLEIKNVLGGSEVTLNIPDEDSSPRTSSTSPSEYLNVSPSGGSAPQLTESASDTPIVALRLPQKRCLAPTLSLSKEGATNNGRSSIFNLRRKSSVPNLFPNHSPVDNASQNNNNDDDEESSKLRNRRSWTNQSISSIGSTTSSSSLGSSIRNKTTLSLPRQRKLSDVASWFWPDDSSNGNYGDNESSPYHSSAENIHPIQDHQIRPTIRRKKTASIFSKAISIRKVSSMFKSGEGSQRKNRSGPPKIEITVVRNHSSDTEQHSPNLPADKKVDDEYSPASAYEPEDFNEKCEHIIQGILCPKQKKSFYVAREILSSEKTFVNVLHLITTSFPSSIEATAKRLRLPNRGAIISDRDLDDIQGGLPTLRVMNEFILKDLYDRIYNWKENAKIADIFVTKGPFLKHYTHYIKDFEKHIKIFDSLCEKQANFAAAVREFESSKQCQFLGLKSYMLKPVQRMPQYALLLEDYLKTLDEDHPDLEDTKKAIQIVKSVAEHANEAIRTQITIERLIQLQARLQDYVIVGDNRMIVKEGELQKASRKENQPRYFVLMSDVLLVMNYVNTASSTAHKDSPLKLKYNLPLNRMKVILPSYDETSCEFSIISRAISFSVFAKSQRDRDQWVEAMQHTIQEFMDAHPCIEPEFDTVDTSERLGKLAPVMVQDSRVSMCQSCHYEFKLAFRRHHCRSCGQVVCRNCSSNEAPLEYLEFDTGRVCDTCYDILLNDFEREYPKDGMIFIRNRLNFRKTNVTNITSLTRVSKIKNTIRLPTKSELAKETADAEVKIRGYLKWREKKVWNRNWVVLIGRVLYFFLEPEDTVAVKTIPVLGYNFEVGYFQEQNQELRCFKLGHVNREDICFQVENQAMVKKWEIALSEAVTLRA